LVEEEEEEFVSARRERCAVASISSSFDLLTSRAVRIMGATNCLGFGREQKEAKEEGELSPPRKKKTKRGDDGEDVDDDKAPKAIVGSRPRGQNLPLEFRKENRDGIGRPKGDVGRERFVGVSNVVAAKTTKTTTEERVYVAYGDARREPLTVRLFCFGFGFSRAEKNSVVLL
jgi:hypothetical protein